MERIDELFSDVCFPIDSRDLRNPNFHYQTPSQSRLIAVGPTHVVVEIDKYRMGSIFKITLHPSSTD